MIYFVANLDKSWLWQKRFCNVNFDNTITISNTNTIRILPKILKPTNMICKESVMGKQTKSSFKSKAYTSKGRLYLVHIDLCGPTKTRSDYGEKYFILFVDGYSRKMWVAFHKEKFEAFD